MEKQLTNEQIARVFAMYWQCCQFLINKKPATVTTINRQGVISYGMPWSFNDCKLILTPLSAISDEDAIEVAKIYEDGLVPSWHEHYDGSFVFEQGEKVVAAISGKINKAYYNMAQMSFCRQYLIQKGYAVPLFIELNHPLNGKTAIELGLAIDKTTVSNQQVK